MSSRAPLLLIAAVCLLCFFWNLGGNGLFDLDEALYAECAREMVLDGDYVIPHVNRQPFYEKPPLVYWAGAAFYRLFGRNELTTRLPSALASLMVVGLIWRFGGRRLGRRAGLLAALFFALSPIVFGAARQLTTDATLDLCIAASLLAWFHATHSPEPSVRRWILGFWIGLALGVLTKGLPGVLIPVATVVVYSFLRRRSIATDRRAAPDSARETPPAGRDLLPWHVTGFFVFLLVALPWHLLAIRSAGDAFVSEYIVRQHIERFRGGDTSHLAPFWFFIPGFLVGAFPWSFFVPAALLSRADSDGVANRADFRRFLKIWAILVFLMFSASGSKLISYILPMYPPAALLAGDWIARAMDRREARRSLLWCGGTAFALSGLLLLVIGFSSQIIAAIERSTGKPIRMDQIPDGALMWGSHLLLATTLATGFFLVFVAFDQRKRAIIGLVAGMTLFYLFAVLEGLPLIDRALLRPLRDAVQPFHLDAEAAKLPLIVKTGGTRRPSVLFYLPDNMLRNRIVFEATDPGKVLSLIRTHAPCRALVDRQSAPGISALTGMTAQWSNASWEMLGVPAKK